MDYLFYFYHKIFRDISKVYFILSVIGWKEYEVYHLQWIGLFRISCW